MQEWSDETRQAVGENYAFILGKIMSEAVSDGFWFECDRFEGRKMDWTDLNWKRNDGECSHSSVWET